MMRKSEKVPNGMTLVRALVTLMVVLIVCMNLSCWFDDGGHGGRGKREPGCEIVPEGKAMAVQIKSSSQLIGGRSAEGRVGDYKIQNNRVSVIISSPARATAFIPFGGYIIDAAPTDDTGCPLPEDHFGEMGMVIGRLDLVNLENTSIRGFDPSFIEIVNDGSDGGPAVIRVHGTDSPVPLIETGILLLLPDKGFSNPMDLDVQTDYILPPDSNEVLMVSTITNTLDSTTLVLGFGDAFLFGDGMTTRYPDAGVMEVLDEELFSDVKFLTSSDGRISYGYGLDNRPMVSISISNITPALDQGFLESPAVLGPHESLSFERMFEIIEGDANAVAREFYPLWGISAEPLFGMVVEENTGSLVEDAVVEIYRAGGDPYMTDFMTGPDGFFSGTIPGGTYEAVVSAEARPGSGPIPLPLPLGYGYTFLLGAPGKVLYDIRDTSGENIPARLTFLQGGAIVKYVVTATGKGSALILPGIYDVAISRGPEYTLSWWYNLTVPEGGEALVRATLERVVDTSGFIAGDLHIHAEPSPDSDFPLIDRISACLAEGVEFVAATDHDVITDYAPTIRAMGVEDKIVSICGEEVSSPILGHINGFHLNRNPALRGNGAVDWFKLSAQGTFDALRDLGATVVQVNHPREEHSGYFNAILFNRTTGGNDMTDPGHLGLDPGDEILSFEFNALEVINGSRKDQTFFDPGEPDESGTLRDWFTLLNMGYKIAATGNSDSHRISSAPGFARNMIASSTDSPGMLDAQELLNAIAAQKNVVSTGAFIRVRANDSAGMGETITDTDGTVELNIRVESPPWVDVTELVVFGNCSVVETISIADQSQIVKYDGIVSVSPTQDTWYVVMAVGAEDLFPVAPGFDHRVPRALTNPIYVDRDGTGGFDAPGIIACSSPY